MQSKNLAIAIWQPCLEEPSRLREGPVLRHRVLLVTFHLLDDLFDGLVLLLVNRGLIHMSGWVDFMIGF